jgi:putative ABC transport system permease protein
MLIWLFIQDELSFEQMHANKKNIYRIEGISYDAWNSKLEMNERWSRDAWLQIGAGPAFKEEIPEVESFTRFSGGSAIFTYKDRIFSEDLKYVDRGFFKMFSFPMLMGSAEKVFSDKLEIVITPKIAEKYFGDEDPIGKTVALDFSSHKEVFTVTGVIEAPPVNSSFEFNVLVPQQNREGYERQITRWGNFNSPTFVQLRPDADTTLFRRNLAGVCQKYFGPVEERWRKEAVVPIPDGIKLLEFVFTPLVDMHLKKNVGWHKVSDRSYSYILGGIALLILLIASINYISLALTTSAARRMEVGIRKVVGAVRRQLFYQFGFESIILALLSMVVGFVMVALFLPAFNDFTAKAIQFREINWLMFTGIGLALALTVGILAGSYPSIFLARFKPVAVLKGKFTTKLQASFTKPLVVLQFGMSAFLIVSSVIMYRQMSFIATKDLGFNQEAVLTVNNQVGWSNEAERVYLKFKTELEKIPSIESIAGTSQPFADGFNRYGYSIDGVNHLAFVYAVDPNFIPTLGMELVFGRNFDAAIASDSNAVVVNESLVRDLGWKDLGNAYLNWQEDTTNAGAKVIGVLRDFNFQSLEAPIEPMLLTMDRHDGGHITSTLIRLSGNDMPGTIHQVEATWRALFPEKPFDYSFLDETIAKQYKMYEKRMNIMAAATGFAMLISCLGLFGLAGINAVNRTKEIGIRKVMGAEVSNIFVLLNKQYVWLSLIAFALAMPFSWYVMNKWLSGFKFQQEIGWEVFAVSILAGLAVALATVSYHAVRVSLINPAETLKYE